MNSQYVEYCRNLFKITDIDQYTRGYKFQSESADEWSFYKYVATKDEWDIMFCDQFFGKLQGHENSYQQGRIDAYLDGKSVERPPTIPSQEEFDLNLVINNLSHAKI